MQKFNKLFVVSSFSSGNSHIDKTLEHLELF